MMLGAGAVLASGLAPPLRSASAPVILGNVSLSFYSVTGAVVVEVLKRLGHRVEVREGSHEEIFPLLADDSIDLMAAAWLPEGHAEYWARYGSDVQEVAALYHGATFFWGVPGYTMPDVESIADLVRADVVERMNRRIQGIGAGAAISTRSLRAMTAYGLQDQGYTWRSGTQAEWLAACRGAVARREWFIFPTWAPQFLNRDGRMRKLQDPRGILGGTNRAVLVAPRSRFIMLPETTRRTLARIALDLDAVTRMDWDVNVGGRTSIEAAQAWLAANQTRVNSWFEDVRDLEKEGQVRKS